MVERALRRTRRQALGLTTLGIGLGAGTTALGSLGNQASANASQGLVNLSAALPGVGAVAGVGLVLGATESLLPRERMIRQRRRRLL